VPEVVDDHVRFTLADLGPDVTGVRLDCDPALPGARDMRRHGGVWRLRLPRPEVQRVEYRFGVCRGDDEELVLDPDNASTVATAFGDRSVLEMPGYRPPSWLTDPRTEGIREDLTVRGETHVGVPVTVWAPADARDDEALPLLVVHDGPEYDRLASLTRFCGAGIASGRLPRHRVALFDPVRRDAWYSGSPRYLRTETADGLDQIERRYAVTSPVVVMGASLGGLTALLAGLLGAPRIGGVFAQSGSFFQPRHDSSEKSFTYFDRIARAVASVLDSRHTDHPLRVSLTCGEHEENQANNADMAAALSRAGHDVTYRTVPDLHNYTAWRDALDPALTDLLCATWEHTQG
jgi:enterochelin esterase-like enzyme